MVESLKPKKNQMVVKRAIAHYSTVGHQNGGGELIKSAQIAGVSKKKKKKTQLSKKTLQGSCMNDLNGLLYQLSALSTIADELFQSVLDSSKETFTRITNISTRLKSCNEKLDSVDAYISQNSTKFYGNHAYQLS